MKGFRGGSSEESGVEDFAIERNTETSIFLYVDMRESKKEMRMVRFFEKGNRVAKWSFKKINGNELFVGVNLQVKGDFMECKKHTKLSEEQFEKEAPLSN